MSPAPVAERHRVGELRPSQLLFSFGIGSVVDLPHLSVMVMGLDDWERSQLREIGEERLLAAVRKQLGSQVKKLYLPPAEDDSAFSTNPFDRDQRSGVPVVPFPRWMRCPCAKFANTGPRYCFPCLLPARICCRTAASRTLAPSRTCR